MPFSGGIFTRTNGTFNGPTVWQQDASAGVNIVDTRHDFHDQDIADGLSTAILKDGTQTITADVPFGGLKIIQLGDASANTDAMNKQSVESYVQSYLPTVAPTFIGTLGGTSTAYTGTVTPAITSYPEGLLICFIPNVNCGNAPTLNLNSLGAKAFTYFTSQGIFSNQLLANQLHYAVYTSNQFLILGANRPILSSTPTLGFLSGGATTITAQTLNLFNYSITGKEVSFQFNADVTWGAVPPDALTFTLPFTVSSTAQSFAASRGTGGLPIGFMGEFVNTTTAKIAVSSGSTALGTIYRYYANGTVYLA